MSGSMMHCVSVRNLRVWNQLSEPTQQLLNNIWSCTFQIWFSTDCL